MNAIGKYDNTFLIGLLRDYKGIAEMLIKAGANVNAVNRYDGLL